MENLYEKINTEKNAVRRYAPDVLNIPDLLQIAYNAGKNGELFEMEWVENEY